MARASEGKGDPTTDLLAKLLVLQLYSLGATQSQIARFVGRQKLWVNKLLKGLPRGGKE